MRRKTERLSRLEIEESILRMHPLRRLRRMTAAKELQIFKIRLFSIQPISSAQFSLPLRQPDWVHLARRGKKASIPNAPLSGLFYASPVVSDFFAIRRLEEIRRHLAC